MIEGSAEFSDDRTLRLRLDRWWAPGPRAIVCMANPSFAGAERDDPTVRNLIALLKALGYPGFTVVNWLPHIASNPFEMFSWRDAFSKRDVVAYAHMHDRAVEIVSAVAHDGEHSDRFVAWGNLVPMVPHTMRILQVLSCEYRHDLLAFATTKSSAPTHPAARGRNRLIPGTPPVIWVPKNG